MDAEGIFLRLVTTRALYKCDKFVFKFFPAKTALSMGHVILRIQGGQARHLATKRALLF